MRTCFACFLMLATLARSVCAAEQSAVERMYVLYCGESTTKDVSANWSPGVNVGVARDFSDNCYLIKHSQGWLLWDSGISDSIADMPDGMVAASGLLTLYVKKTLQSQLSELNLTPADIQRVAFSHFHSDHVGNASLFVASKVYVQQAEYDAAFGPDAAKFGFAPKVYEKLAESDVVKLKGDYDVFGDGSVVILSTPGHTPGHQSLQVRLPKTGVVILSGDMVHFQDNWDNQRVPARNFNKKYTLQSMQRIARIVEDTPAQLWINHDKAQSDAIAHAPQFVE